MSAGRTVRIVSVIPPAKKTKKEVPDEEEAKVGCRLCSKTFVSETALNNHARLMHVVAYTKGDPAMWMAPIVKSEPVDVDEGKRLEDEKIKQKTEEMIKSMKPTSLTSLANENVSYIIIKAADQNLLIPQKKAKVEKLKDKEAGIVVIRKDKEIKPITGPFECLHPSTLVADGACHQMFFSCCEYSIHCRDEHTRRRKALKCQVCEKPLCGDSESEFVCQVCGEQFENNTDLTAHKDRKHLKLKPFPCTICDKRFTQRAGLQQHIRMHSGIRPFACTYCEKSFTQKSGLDQHLRIHTKVRPFRCVICEKTFSQSVHVKQHMRTHTNVTPFQCGICHKKYKQSSHLNYHLRLHNAMSSEIVEVSMVEGDVMDEETVETFENDDNVHVMDEETLQSVETIIGLE